MILLTDDSNAALVELTVRILVWAFTTFDPLQVSYGLLAGAALCFAYSKWRDRC